jgi:quercetin dioxygenase-like cupin family protein
MRQAKIFVLAIAAFALAFDAAAQPSASAKADPYEAFKPNAASIPFTDLDKLPWTGTVGRQQQYKVFGDSSKPGPYVVLMKWYPGAFSKPHLHENARYITVIQGTWWVSSSTIYDASKTYPLSAGSVVINEANQVHWDGAKDAPVILQISGMGPAPSIPVDEAGNRKPPGERGR